MVAPAKKAIGIKPSEFYGSSLPRPRIFNSPKLNPERVDPPVPVMDPLLSWARDAHWSMGGLSFQRLRLQGRIEGKVSKLRSQRERSSPRSKKDSAPLIREDSVDRRALKKRVSSVSPPAAPVAAKRRKLLYVSDDVDDENESEEIEVGSVRTRRKLWDDFNKVADDVRSKEVGDRLGEGGKLITKENKSLKESDIRIEPKAARTSPRLAKRRLN